MAEVRCESCSGMTFTDAKFCGHCGTARTATVGTGLTNQVRSAMQNAPDDKKHGQQKWGLFETNSQRARGISTDQSLQEIDDAVQNGVVVRQGAPKQYVEVTSTSGGASSAGGGVGNFGSSAGGGGRVGNFGSSAGGEQHVSYTTTSKAGDKLEPAKFPAGNAGAGAAFFQQHAASEQAKYKPGFKGSLN